MQAQDREKGSEAVQLCFKLVIDNCMQFLNVFSLKPINPIAQGIKNMSVQQQILHWPHVESLW